MELEGIVRNGVIVPDTESALPDGIRVRISIAPGEVEKTFGQRFAQFKGSIPDLPADLTKQHENYRLGTPKR